MKKLIDYLKEQGVLGASKVNGPNGAFISCSTNPDPKVRLTREDKMIFTIPCGKKSQKGTLAEYNVLITDDGNAIATTNNYSVAETLQLEPTSVEEQIEMK